MTELKTPFVVKDRLILKAGKWNGKIYPKEEVIKFGLWLQRIEKERNVEGEFRNALSIFEGADHDHADSSGTWVGEAKNVRIDSEAGEVHADLYFVDEDCARKIQYQLENPPTKFAISPHLSVIEKDGICTDIKSKSIGLVLNPAQGEEAYLSAGAEINDLSKREEAVLFSLGDIDLEVEEMEKAEVEKLIEEKVRGLQDSVSSEIAGLKASISELSESLKKKKAEEEEDEESKEKLQKAEKKDDVKETQEKENEEEYPYKEGYQYPYKPHYGYPAIIIIGCKEKYGYGKTPPLSIARNFAVKNLDGKSLKRIGEDILDAVKPLMEAVEKNEALSLENFGKVLSALDETLAGVPFTIDEAAVEELTKKLASEEEMLEKRIAQEVEKRAEEMLSAAVPGRKGLVLQTRAENVEDKPQSINDIRLGLRKAIQSHFGVNEK